MARAHQANSGKARDRLLRRRLPLTRRRALSSEIGRSHSARVVLGDIDRVAAPCGGSALTQDWCSAAGAGMAAAKRAGFSVVDAGLCMGQRVSACILPCFRQLASGSRWQRASGSASHWTCRRVRLLQSSPRPNCSARRCRCQRRHRGIFCLDLQRRRGLALDRRSRLSHWRRGWLTLMAAIDENEPTGPRPPAPRAHPWRERSGRRSIQRAVMVAPSGNLNRRRSL
jgi:hypothetical protein